MTTAGRNKGGNDEGQKAAEPAESENKRHAAGAGASEDELAALRKDFDRLREDVAALTEALRAAVQGGAQAQSASGGGESAASSSDDTEKWQELRDRFEQTREHSREAIQDVETEVKRHPLASLTIAFGVGYLYARLTHLFR